MTQETRAPMVLVMGITASGKSTAAKALAETFGWPMIEADDYHSVEAVAKMTAGMPLCDDDRWPWLARLVATKDALVAGGASGVVLACSALKRAYRDMLAPDLVVYLEIDRAIGEARAAARANHFAGAALIASQLEALEPPTRAERPLIIVPAPESVGVKASAAMIAGLINQVATDVRTQLAL